MGFGADDDDETTAERLTKVSRQLSKAEDRLEYVEKKTGKLQAELNDLQTAEPKAAAGADDQRVSYLEILIEQWADKNNIAMEDMMSKVNGTKSVINEIQQRVTSLEKFGKAFFEKAVQEKSDRELFEAKIKQHFIEELDPDPNPENICKHKDEKPPELVGQEREAREAQYAALTEHVERLEREASKLTEQLESQARDFRLGVRRLSTSSEKQESDINEVNQRLRALSEAANHAENLANLERLARDLQSDLSRERKERESLEQKFRAIPRAVESVQQELKDHIERVQSTDSSGSPRNSARGSVHSIYSDSSPDVTRRFSQMQNRVDYLEKLTGRTEAKLRDMQAEEEQKTASNNKDEDRLSFRVSYLETLIEQWADKNVAALQEVRNLKKGLDNDKRERETLEQQIRSIPQSVDNVKLALWALEKKVKSMELHANRQDDDDVNKRFSQMQDRIDYLEKLTGSTVAKLQDMKAEEENKNATNAKDEDRVSYRVSYLETLVDQWTDKNAVAANEVKVLQKDLANDKAVRESLEQRLHALPRAVESIKLELKELKELKQHAQPIDASCSDKQDGVDSDVMDRRFKKMLDRIEYLEKLTGSTEAKLRDMQADEGKKSTSNGTDDGRVNYLETLIEQWVDKQNAALDEVKVKVFSEHQAHSKQAERLESLEQLGKKMFTSMSGEKIAREQFQQKLEERMSSVEVLAEGLPDGAQSSCSMDAIKALVADSQRKTEDRLTRLQRMQGGAEELKSLTRHQESTQEQLDCLERRIRQQRSLASSDEVQSALAKSQEPIKERLDSLEKLVAKQWRPFFLGLQKAVDAVGD